MKKQKDPSQNLDKGELQKLLKRKSSELEQLNRELEIESALEKVRVIALGMKAPDDMLNICKTISLQLQLLGVKEIRNVQTAIFYESRGSYMNYEYYAKHRKTIITETNYTDHKIHKAFAAQMLKGKGEFFITHIKGKKVKDWIAYQKTTNVFIDRFLEKANSLNYYWHSLGPVALGISTYVPLREDELKLFKRFLNVFELAYTRYLDIEQALSQAKEAKLEAALEKVRAQAMSMRKSEELIGVCEAMYKELAALGFDDMRNAQISIKNSAESSYFVTEYSDHVSIAVKEAPLDSSPLLKNIYEEIERSDDAFYQREFSGKDFKNWRKWRMSIDAAIDPRIMKATSMWFYLYSIGSGYLGISTFHAISNEKIEVLKRFRNVFELSYRRYVDVSQAEAQAKESQIQLALERVRARTMAMQHSDELKNAAALLFQQVKSLGAPAYSCGYNIWEKDDKEFTSWMSTQDGSIINGVPNIPLTEDANFIRYVESKQNGEQFFVLELRGERMQEHYEYLKTIPAFKAYFDYAVSVGFDLPETQIHHLANFSNGNLLFITMEPCPEFHDIFKRFAAVFEQTYTRFLDLQKAEAQAREAQIEAALERVRSRTMGMQKSDELREVAVLLYRQFLSLGVNSVLNCGYVEVDEINNVQRGWMTRTDGSPSESFKLPLTGDPVFQNRYDSWKRKDSVFHQVVAADEMKKHIEFSRPKLGSNEVQELIVTKFPDPTIFYCGNFSNGYLHVITGTLLSKEEETLLERFTRVFDQTYTRFLDLQKAEAQTREAQIELGLERVRAKTMAMQKSDELQEVVNNVYERLNELEVGMDGAAICTFIEGTKDYNVWIGDYQEPLRIKFNEFTQVQRDYNDAIERREELFTNTYYGEIKKEYIQFLLEQTVLGINIPEEQKELLLASAFFTTSLACTKNTVFQLYRYTEKSFSKEENDILKRFANVFEQSYTRFLDLQKAEVQTREAQIETALEKVRSRSLAMHKSDELQEVVNTVFEKLKDLNIEMDSANIAIFKEGTREFDYWVASPFQKRTASFHMPYVDLLLTRDLIAARESGTDLSTKAYSFEEKNEWFNWAFKHTDFKLLTEERKQFILDAPSVTVSIAFSKYTGLQIIRYSTQLLTEAEAEILKRFSRVFEQAYIRFNDLQKAEAQIREAQIEASLERVRSKTMAMHNSQDVADTVATMFDELVKLGVETVRCDIAIIDESQTMEVWTAKSNPGEKVTLIIGRLDMRNHPLFVQVYNAWKNKEQFTTYELIGEDLKNYFRNINNSPDYPIRYDIETLPYKQSNNAFMFPEGALFVFSQEPLAIETTQIFKRFAGVFGQTYRRYLDLKKAEAQAREATIEAALEKVRGKAMSMHNSNDLSSTASIVFTELRKLGINPIRCGVGLLNKESRKGQLYSATSSKDGDSLSLVGWVVLSGHPVLTNIYDTWLKNEEYYPELSGEQLKSYYELLLSGLSVPVPSDTRQKQYGTFLPFSVGCLYAWSETPYNEAEIKVLKRFATIIDLTFRRYIELQKSEANAKEAIKQSALDRIRADIASMRTTNDLERITPLIWNELTILGIPFIRCGIFIMDDSQELIHTFLSTPEGKAIAAFHLPYTTPGNISQVLKNWQNKKDYIDHWDESAFTEFADILVKQGGLASAEQYLKTIPHGGFYLHFLPFLQGMLYVGNSTQLTEEELKLIQSVADAFSTAYARYEDFNKLEAAKQTVEKTLVDLKQAQTQLVQSEKMASLGELTAGIAHEIQNPLNFVNNFSEVSNELLDEMITELDNGDADEAKAIANDVKQNLEKINHHGKRADAIVKGMLQHSRSSSGVKEPTDINALADEYLRLAYHGLRAKDKSFNATMKTDYDETIGNINIIPQDIGRVILNLITNAFYAVTEKKKLGIENYEPTVSVSTKKINGKIEVSVKDNGNGISQKLLDKIFQPFFTTKPTGQGTGLGLSLSYDIVKAHGGEINVKTKEGEEAEFVLELPV